MSIGLSRLTRGRVLIAFAVVASLMLTGGCVVGNARDDSTPLPDAMPTIIPTGDPEVSNSPAPLNPPIPTIVIDAEQGVDWPEHCQPEQVAELLVAFTRAFNAGDAEVLQGLLPDGVNTFTREALGATAVADSVGAANAALALQWFSMPDGDGEFVVAHSSEDVSAFARSRHADGDTMSLRWIRPLSVPYLPGVVDLGVEATLQTGDGREIALEGKAGIDCSHQRLYVWAVGPV